MQIINRGCIYFCLIYIYSRLTDQIPVMEYHKLLFTDLAKSSSLPIMLSPKQGKNLRMDFLKNVIVIGSVL